ncbi:hypothetical protein ACFFGV_02360 [Pontibacillus salicampi]|uniref:Uncharacterized protein n=1 Tax=Pontibacillus salicampi TaxID=1449801 RepID=A0ABV6LJ54_9BACI
MSQFDGWLIHQVGRLWKSWIRDCFIRKGSALFSGRWYRLENARFPAAPHDVG